MAWLSKGNIYIFFFSTWDYINKRGLKLLKVVGSSNSFIFVISYFEHLRVSANED